MLEIKLNVQLNDLSEKSIELLSRLLSSISGCPKGAVVTGTQVEKQSKEEKLAPAPKPVAEKPVAEKPVAEKPVAEKPVAEKPVESKQSIGIEDVRKVLAQKVNDHRDTIKQKLNELGAPSVTKLAPEKYKEMFDFLKSL